MADWEAFLGNIRNIGTALAAEAQKKREMEEAKQMILFKTQAEKSPFERLLDFSKVSKALYEIGIDPKMIFGEDTFPQDNLPSEVIPQRQDNMVMPSPDIGISPVGNFGKTFPETSEIEATKFESTPFGIRPKEFGRKGAVAEEEVTKGAAKASAKLTEEYTQSLKNFGRVANLFGQLVAQGKLMAEQQGGMGIFPAVKGEFGRLKTRLTGKTSKEINPMQGFGGISGFEGQLQEVTLALAPILSGQNRILKSVINMISKTLPSKISSEFDFAQQTQQSLKNAFRLTIAFQRNLMSPEEIKELNKADEKTINMKLKQLLDRTQLTEDEDVIFNDIWQQVKTTPAAEPVSLFGKNDKITQKQDPEYLKFLQAIGSQ